MERDPTTKKFTANTKISTHTLTWSVTQTHSVYISCIQNFNSHAHVERDATTVATQPLLLNFNSHAHVERDDALEISENDLIISTHTLTWSVTWFNLNSA